MKTIRERWRQAAVEGARRRAGEADVRRTWRGPAAAWIVAAGAIVGMLAWPDLLAGLAESGGAAPVGEKMRAPPGVLHPAEGVERVLERERGERLRARPVVRDGRIVGLFTAENLADSVLLRSAAEHAGRRRTAFPRGVMAGPGGQTVTGGD